MATGSTRRSGKPSRPGCASSASACLTTTPACCCAGWTSPLGSDGAPLMDNITSRALVADPETRRALQLDTLSAILPMERRDRLAELLTDDDVETLKHLAREGIGENSLRALASDLAYLGSGRDRRGAAVAG